MIVRRVLPLVLTISVAFPVAINASTAATARAEDKDRVTAYSDFKIEFRAGVAEVEKRSDSVGGTPRSADVARVHPAGREDFEAWAHEVQDLLGHKLGDEFAGMAVHPVNNIAYIGTTTDGEIERGLLAGLDQPKGYEVRLTAVSTTAAERDDAMTRLSSAGIESFGAMTLDDTVQVYVNNEAVADQVGRALGVADVAGRLETIEQHDAVRVGAVSLVKGEMSSGDDSLASGVANFKADGSGYCTFGPNVVEIATGTRYATTAGHCKNHGVWRNGQFFARREYVDVDGEDWAVHHIPSVIAPATGWVWVSPTWSIPIHGPWRSYMSGTARSMKGRVTGYTTGVYYGTFCGHPTATYNRAEGDSGGPVLYPYGSPRIAGLHSGDCTYYEASTSMVIHSSRFTAVYLLELGGGTTAQYRILTHSE